jgi:cytoskeletal protein RodZ
MNSDLVRRLSSRHGVSEAFARDAIAAIARELRAEGSRSRRLSSDRDDCLGWQLGYLGVGVALLAALLCYYARRAAQRLSENMPSGGPATPPKPATSTSTAPEPVKPAAATQTSPDRASPSPKDNDSPALAPPPPPSEEGAAAAPAGEKQFGRKRPAKLQRIQSGGVAPTHQQPTGLKSALRKQGSWSQRSSRSTGSGVGAERSSGVSFALARRSSAELPAPIEADEHADELRA